MRVAPSVIFTLNYHVGIAGWSCKRTVTYTLAERPFSAFNFYRTLRAYPRYTPNRDSYTLWWPTITRTFIVNDRDCSVMAWLLPGFGFVHFFKFGITQLDLYLHFSWRYNKQLYYSVFFVHQLAVEHSRNNVAQLAKSLSLRWPIASPTLSRRMRKAADQMAAPTRHPRLAQWTFYPGFFCCNFKIITYILITLWFSLLLFVFFLYML